MAYQGITADIQQATQEAFNSGLLTSFCTVQQPDGLMTTDGAASGNFINVAGLVGIPCMDAVLAPGNIEATEVKELADIMARSFRHVMLNGYYPALFVGPFDSHGNPYLGGQQLGWRVIVDFVIYDLLGAELDSQNTQTRLQCQLVTL
jgi:hypothetical protein